MCRIVSNLLGTVNTWKTFHASIDDILVMSEVRILRRNHKKSITPMYIHMGMILPCFEIVQKFSRVHHICVSCHSGANNNLHVNVLVLSKQQMEKRSQTPASCWLMTYTLNSFIGARWLQFLFDSNVGVVICSNRISSKWSRHHGPRVPFKKK